MLRRRFKTVVKLIWDSFFFFVFIPWIGRRRWKVTIHFVYKYHTSSSRVDDRNMDGSKVYEEGESLAMLEFEFVDE